MSNENVFGGDNEPLEHREAREEQESKLEDGVNVSPLTAQVGRGIITRSKESGVNYLGTMPFDAGEEVLVIRTEDFQKFITHADHLMFRRPVMDMTEDFYSAKKTKHPIPDTIYFVPYDKEVVVGRPVTLILDRHFYSIDPKKYLCVRWESIEHALEEENPETGERIDG